MQRLYRMLSAGLLVVSCALSWPVASVASVPATCGPRIPVNDVMVVDLEAPDDERRAAEEQAGPYRKLNQKPISYGFDGSRYGTVLSARRSAAARGCDVLVVHGLRTYRYEVGGGTPNRDGGGGGGVMTGKRLLVDFARRDG